MSNKHRGNLAFCKIPENFPKENLQISPHYGWEGAKKTGNSTLKI